MIMKRNLCKKVKSSAKVGLPKIKESLKDQWPFVSRESQKKAASINVI